MWSVEHFRLRWCPYTPTALYNHQSRFQHLIAPSCENIFSDRCLSRCDALRSLFYLFFSQWKAPFHCHQMPTRLVLWDHFGVLICCSAISGLYHVKTIAVSTGRYKLELKFHDGKYSSSSRSSSLQHPHDPDQARHQDQLTLYLHSSTISFDYECIPIVKTFIKLLLF